MKKDQELTIEEAIDKVGGFGLYQMILSIFVILSFNTVGFFMYNMHFN